MFYRKILHQAWTTTWKNKYLWFFGLFAVLFSASGSEAFLKIFDQQTGANFFSVFQFFPENNISAWAMIKNFFGLIIFDPLSFFILTAVFLIFLILGGFLLWLSVVSQAALVSESAKIASGKKNNFKEGLEAGMNNFWPVFILIIGFKAVVFLGLSLIVLPILISTTKIGLMIAGIIFIILFLILIPAVFCLSLTVKYAICFIVIKKNNWQEAIKQSWKFFIHNWLVSLEMTICLFLINLAIILVLILALLILAVPILFVALLMAKLTFLFVFWLIVFTAGLFLLFFLVAVGAVLSTFQISAWTSLFIQLTGKGGVSKLARIFDKK